MQEGVDAFLEEAVVRRELSDNFCFYEPNYDNLSCCANWAKESLDKHKSDEREHTYSWSAPSSSLRCVTSRKPLAGVHAALEVWFGHRGQLGQERGGLLSGGHGQETLHIHSLAGGREY